MTIQTPQTPQAGWQPDPLNPKAAAKAAKAYAKATRPWYKKKRFIIPGVVVALAIIGSAVGSSGGSGDDKPTTASQKVADTGNTAKSDNSSESNEDSAPAPDNSSKGKGALTWGNWEVVGKIQVKDDGFHGYDVVTRVKNTGESPDEGLFTVTILKGQRILGTADCSTSTVAPGSIGLADCVSMDDYIPGWTEVTIEDMF